MHHALALLLVLAAPALDAEAPLAATHAAVPVSVFTLLPAGHHHVEVLEWSASPRYAELVERFGTAVRRDSRWFQEAKAAAGDGPLAYDPRCGLSESEYAELLAGVGGAQLTHTRHERLEVRHEAAGLRFAGGPATAPLATVVVDPTLAVRSSFGTCRGWRPLETEVPGVGRLRGHECSHQELGPSLELVDAVRLAVGTLDDGRRLLIYQGSRRWRDVAQRQESVYLRFAAPDATAVAAAR